MRNTIMIVLAGLCLPAAGLPAAAQGAGATTEQNLGSAGQFRNITSTGVTKPPGATLDSSANPRSLDTPKKNRALDRKIETGICVGCN
ncbi:hypothetical protein G3T14_02345 [Methylobacterium sp. BTF04]|uniref:hypothetical protein n=1 Tax=Methylobacterium sp. BTF04 TaxID=2708300 RepID=UPI0013D42B5E|nr:hypothetical protein [Methylobacterium sp. BTF04]NEU10972.1 hypothetical protein [Methylobacterium sp. BTF04]